ncbi:MAG: hypothetical protein Kow0032_27780 [Methyloligellaceae bacterium]|nr:MAG: antibiotic biosynthesis monooxygenase [Alphaproteobacteria bacterium]
MIAIIVDFEAKPGHGADLRDALLAQASNSKTHEPGCRHFDVVANPDNPEQFLLYELYDDAAAVEAHRAADYYARFRETIDPIVARRDFRQWELL